ncbi:MAG: hypothetical protein FWH37_07930 [Candidatus Bathyarchaeota archaeon]|nr:hypothetical protein [Candidatus Termiticorpusculum sp.]
MSNLINSCEYLNVDKTCITFSENLTKSSRQQKCKNSQKTICCYLCNIRLQCVISCKYLGQSENYAESTSMPENTQTIGKDVKTELLPFKDVPVTFCFSCNVEMVWATTQFVVDNWHGNKPQFIGDKTLPVTVFLCTKCGKIEFIANLNKKEVDKNGSP